MEKYEIAIVGGGAAGFFTAAQILENEPNASIVILEASNKLLAKVKISGGGRCNVTHACFENEVLRENYPRGSKELRQVFSRFAVEDAVEWFANKGVELKTENDGRMFPTSNSSQSIVNCLRKSADGVNVKIICGFRVKKVVKRIEFQIYSENGEVVKAKKLLIASGGNASGIHYNFLRELGHTIIPPIPSLFTFNVKHKKLHALMGQSVPQVIISVPTLKLKEEGPLLITHWGFSGPAVLKLSATGARFFSALNYQFNLSIDWLAQSNDTFPQSLRTQSAVQVRNAQIPFSKRLWEYLLGRANCDGEKRCADLSKAELSGLEKVLRKDEYRIEGKSTFKEEFVTCGGVALDEVDMRTMESKIIPGLYFAGEILDIDGYTGGYNFQAAWSTAFVAAWGIINSKTVHL